MPDIFNPTEEKGFTRISESAVVENKVLAVVDAIREYDPALNVLFLDPSRSDDNDLISEPYLVVETRNGVTRRVFGVWEMNWSVLDRIRKADSWQTDTLADIDKHNEAIKKAIKDSQIDADAERRDITAHVIASPKGSYTFHGEGEELIKISDDDPRTRKEPNFAGVRRDSTG